MIVYVGRKDTTNGMGWYPKKGTSGTILNIDSFGIAYVQWERGSTSKDDSMSHLLPTATRIPVTKKA